MSRLYLLYCFSLLSISLFAGLPNTGLGSVETNLKNPIIPPLPIDGHFEKEWYFGLKAGVSFSWLTELDGMIISDIYDESTYSINEGFFDRGLLGFTTGLYFSNRRSDVLGIQLGFNYTGNKGGNLLYSSNESDGLEYEMQFKYHYISFVPQLKIYPGVDFFHIDIGPDIGFNVRRTNIKYTSNLPDLGPDDQIQKNLRNVIKGEIDMALALGFGFEWQQGLSIAFQYNLGLSDMISTEANGYYFDDPDNYSHTMALTVGYTFPITD